MAPDKYTFVGDTGASLNATLKSSSGAPIDLTDASSITLEMQSFSGAMLGGSVTVVDPVTGRVRYDFQSEDVATAGDYEAVFTVEFPQGTITYPSSGPFTIRVQDFDDVSTLPDPIVTPDEAFQFTGGRITISDLWKAQSFVSIVLGLDLTDTEVMAYVADSDLRRIKQAISFWATELNKKAASGNTNFVTLDLPPGVKSVSQGDASITFAGSSSTNSELVPPSIVQSIFSRFSWRNRKTIQPMNSLFQQAEQQAVTNLDQLELF